ncbi:hypothetical protein DFH08DRAFT_243021 [Mycena albidolilacea]|uniref:Uncharacterized protein n=1 Tax=Mycena albidolilacea TaxID=1033008 RepID=A0AAD6ZVZ8_9AGAR|nr:hypothetical protein DFH08DRAFT_243021 [Mycena albidolilacea]
MGDIDLQREIRLDKHSGVAEYRRERRSVRKLYSAKIPGQKSSVTVTTYQGENAGKEWQRDVAKYTAVRHPNIVQLCGTASGRNIYATIFHDDLIPFQHFVGLHRHSPISIVYIYAYMSSMTPGITRLSRMSPEFYRFRQSSESNDFSLGFLWSDDWTPINIRISGIQSAGAHISKTGPQH